MGESYQNAVGFLDDFKSGLKLMIGNRYSNEAQLAKAAGTTQTNIQRYISGERDRNLSVIGGILDRLNFRLIGPDDLEKLKDEMAGGIVADELYRILRKHGVTTAQIIGIMDDLCKVDDVASGDESSRHKQRAAGSN